MRPCPSDGWISVLFTPRPHPPAATTPPNPTPAQSRRVCGSRPVSRATNAATRNWSRSPWTTSSSSFRADAASNCLAVQPCCPALLSRSERRGGLRRAARVVTLDGLGQLILVLACRAQNERWFISVLLSYSALSELPRTGRWSVPRLTFASALSALRAIVMGAWRILRGCRGRSGRAGGRGLNDSPGR
jgi:hypothetical protein